MLNNKINELTGATGLIVHGGFCASLTMATCQKYLSMKHPNTGQQDPLHLHVQYLGPIPHGQITVVVRELRVGKTHSVMQVDLCQPGSLEPCVTSLVTFGKLSLKGGRTIAAPALQLPDRKLDCARVTERLLVSLIPPTAKLRGWMVKGNDNILWSPAMGQNARGMWLRPDNEDDSLDFNFLGMIADLVSFILNFTNTITQRKLLKDWRLTASRFFQYLRILKKAG